MHGSAGARTSKLDANGWPRRAVAAGAQFGDIIANHVVVSQIVLLKRAIGEGGHQECVGEGKRTVQCLVSWRKRGPHADGVSLFDVFVVYVFVVCS